MELPTQKEVQLMQATRLENACQVLSENYKCPNPDSCREGDACPSCDAYHNVMHDMITIANELRGHGGYITKD